MNIQSIFRKAAGALALLFGSVVFSLVAAEIAIRVYSGVAVFEIRNYVIPTVDIIRANSAVMDFDPLVGWRLKANFGVVGSGHSTGPLGIRTNGFRRDDPPTGAVLAVGDSFTAGSGVLDAETWPAVLERRLGAPVLNAGVGAFGTDQIVLHAEQLSEILKPSVIVVGILSQDNLRNQYRVYGGGHKPWFTVENGKPVLQGVPVPNVVYEPIPLHWTRHVFGYSYLVHFTMTRLNRLRWWVDNNLYIAAMTDRQSVEVSCALMHRLVALRERHGSRIVVALFWGAGEAALSPPPWYGQPPLACAEALGIETVDLYPVLHRLSRDKDSYEKLWINEAGVLGHPSAAGHELMAEEIGNRIERR